MAKRGKAAVRVVAFLMIAALTFEGVTAICRRSSWAPETTVENGYDTYSRLDDLTGFPIDVAAFGPSLCATSFMPLELYEQYGMSAYNIGGSWQPMPISYLLLKELLRSQSPKVVLLETYNLFMKWRGRQDSYYRVALDALPLSETKWEVIKEHRKDKASESRFSYIFNIYKYHFAWKDLKEYGFSPSDQAKDRYLHYGYRIRTGIYRPSDQYIDFQGWMEEETDRIDYDEEGYEYACRFIESCQEAGISIVLYKDLMAQPGSWSLEHHNTVQDLADSYGIPFIDFNMHDVYTASGCDVYTDLNDGGHDNFLGAKKVTQYLGRYLHENYDLADHRNDPDYKDLEAANARFQRIISGEQLVVTRDMPTYLDRLLDLDGRNYTVIFSVKDDCQRGLDDDLKSRLRELGFVSDKVLDEPGHSFIGIWQNGKVIYEDRSDGIEDVKKDALEYRGVLSDGMKYYVKSAGYRCGNVSSIVIDGAEYSKNSRGFNIVVYDNINSWVVDSIVFDTNVDGGGTYHR